MRDYRKLEAYGLALDLVERVYRLTAWFPSEERFGLTQQLRRAVVSVPSNLAEGCARASDAETARFVNIAYGSCQEVLVQLELARRLGFAPTSAEEAREPAERVAKVLYGLWQSLSGSNRSPSSDPRTPSP